MHACSINLTNTCTAFLNIPHVEIGLIGAFSDLKVRQTNTECIQSQTHIVSVTKKSELKITAQEEFGLIGAELEEFASADVAAHAAGPSHAEVGSALKHQDAMMTGDLV